MVARACLKRIGKVLKLLHSAPFGDSELYFARTGKQVASPGRRPKDAEQGERFIADRCPNPAKFIKPQLSNYRGNT
jgi:hypothetical protein